MNKKERKEREVWEARKIKNQKLEVAQDACRRAFSKAWGEYLESIAQIEAER